MSQAGATAEGATRAEPSARVPSDGAEPLDDAAPRGGDVRNDDAIASAPRSAAVGASARDDASARRAARIALERTSLRDRSERSEGALSGVTTSSYHSSDYSTSYSSGSVVSDGPPSEPGPGAPFPETFEEREARLLKTLNASMETNVKYWDRELERGVEAAPVPDVAAIQGVDEDELSTAADADGSLATDSGDRFLDVLGDFESAHDLATPWHDRPKVIARKMVRLIVNRALREKFPPPEVTFWQSLCGACVADERPKRRRRRKSRAR